MENIKGLVKITYTDGVILTGYTNGKTYQDSIYLDGKKLNTKNMVSIELADKVAKVVTEKQTVQTTKKVVVEEQQSTVAVIYVRGAVTLLSNAPEHIRTAIDYACGELTEYGKVYNMGVKRAHKLGLI